MEIEYIYTIGLLLNIINIYLLCSNIRLFKKSQKYNKTAAKEYIQAFMDSIEKERKEVRDNWLKINKSMDEMDKTIDEVEELKKRLKNDVMVHNK